MSFDQETRERHLKRKAEELARKPFLPKELVDFVVEVARMQLEATSKANVCLPPDDHLPGVEENLKGRPLILREEFSYDQDLAKTLFNEAAHPSHQKSNRLSANRPGYSRTS